MYDKLPIRDHVVPLSVDRYDPPSPATIVFPLAAVTKGLLYDVVGKTDLIQFISPSEEM
jgi:hypothetical protein